MNALLGKTLVGRTLASTFAALLSLSACAPEDTVQGEEEPLVGTMETQPVDAPIPEPPIAAEPDAETMEGRLTRVDPVEGVFYVSDADGAVWEFRYSESTDVRDAGVVQGLADTEGSRVRVFHDGNPEARTAVRISVLPEAEPGALAPALP